MKFFLNSTNFSSAPPQGVKNQRVVGGEGKETLGVWGCEYHECIEFVTGGLYTEEI